MKACKKCGESKPLDQFHPNANLVGGREHSCKVCRNKQVADRHNRLMQDPAYRTNRKMRQADNDRVRNIARNGGGVRIAVAPPSTESQRNAAHGAVNYALRTGKIKKPSACESCGTADRRLHAHHNDYTKKLEVQWVCERCHRLAHYKTVPIEEAARFFRQKRRQDLAKLDVQIATNSMRISE